MKKLLTILLTLLMIFTLVGCNSSSIEEQPISKEDQPTTEVETPKEEDIVGGYTDVEDKTVTDELKQLFDSALEGLLGATYEPLELVATQVVAGTNYKFKASGTKTTNPVTKGTYYITIYKDLQGNVSLLDIEVIEETQEEAKEETIKLDSKDLSNVSFWVVFYNPDGSELYRTTLKYGQTPTYKGSTPSYWDSDYFYKFVCWTDKKGNEIKQFKPITGNTYIYAKYEIGGDLRKKDVVESTPTPTSACSNTNDLYHFTYLNYDGWSGYTADYMLYRFNGSGFNDGISFTSEFISPIGSIETEIWYHSSDTYTFVECTDPSHHEPYGHICPHSSTYLLHVYDSICNVDVYQWNSTDSKYELTDIDVVIDWAEFNPSVFSETWIHTNNVNHPGLGSQAECIDQDAHEITCFVAGTQVQYDLLGHTKSIENFKVGDQIVSYNVNTNKYYLAKVGNVFVHDGIEKVNTLADVVLEDDSVITMTPNHPVLTTAGFRAIDNDHRPKLIVGQFVMTGNGWTRIKEIKVYNCKPTVTYNLGIIDNDEIKDDDMNDTYVAGGVVVHNLY